jgi:Zn-finger nucleic acid-binding protein
VVTLTICCKDCLEELKVEPVTDAGVRASGIEHLWVCPECRKVYGVSFDRGELDLGVTKFAPYETL